MSDNQEHIPTLNVILSLCLKIVIAMLVICLPLIAALIGVLYAIKMLFF